MSFNELVNYILSEKSINNDFDKVFTVHVETMLEAAFYVNYLNGGNVKV